MTGWEEDHPFLFLLLRVCDVILTITKVLRA